MLLLWCGVVMVNGGWWMVKVTDCNKIISNGNKMKKDISGAQDMLHLEHLAAAATVAVVVDLSRLVMVWSHH